MSNYWLWRVRVVDWPRALLAQGLGRLCMVCFSLGADKAALRLSRVTNYLWGDIQV